MTTKVTFEGKTYDDVLDAIEDFLLNHSKGTRIAATVPAVASVPALVKKPEKPEKPASPKPDAAERMAKARAAKGKKKAAEPAPQYDKQVKPAPEPEPEPEAAKQVSLEDVVFPEQLPEPEPEPGLSPVELTAIRVKTTADLQEAYSSGRHKQVLALLSRYGNGAKSFRELRIEDFVPIRKAIDEGALA